MKHLESVTQVFDLRMKPLLNTPVQNKLYHANDSFDQIKTLMSQDRSYYRNSSTAMNAADRETMAQWEYRIVDHFGLSRDLVGIAFSVLDRFTEKCVCDRRAYKLAAMTSVFITIKLHNPRRFSIGTLATLSRGEFNTLHIAQMESIMLKTLDWRLNPPTVQSFIYLWGNHLYNGGLYAMESIERACFLAEIAVFDTLLASKGRALLAIAALIEGMVGFGRCGAPAYEQVEAAILRKLKTVFGIHYAQEEIKCIRNRLSHIYTKTSQYQSDYSNQSDASTSSRMVPYNGENKVNKIQHHQESVGICRNMIKTKYLQSPRSVRTKCEQG